jgi:hypothetical protein
MHLKIVQSMITVDFSFHFFQMADAFIKQQIEFVGFALIRLEKTLSVDYEDLCALKDFLVEDAARIFQERVIEDPDDDVDALAKKEIIKLGDQKRCQMLVEDVLENFELPEEVLELIGDVENQCKGIFPQLKWKTPNFLLSLDGCSKQSAHTDGYIWNIRRACDDDPSSAPLSVIIPLQHDTSLLVWPGSHVTSAIVADEDAGENPHIFQIIRSSSAFVGARIKIPVGFALVFRQDLIHAGDSYNESNIRVHAYLDNQKVEREEDQTFWVADEVLTMCKPIE